MPISSSMRSASGKAFSGFWKFHPRVTATAPVVGCPVAVGIVGNAATIRAQVEGLAIALCDHWKTYATPVIRRELSDLSLTTRTKIVATKDECWLLESS